MSHQAESISYHLKFLFPRFVSVIQLLFCSLNVLFSRCFVLTTVLVKKTMICIANPSYLDPERREKIKLNFYFHTFFWCLKRFMKAFKAFIKPLEAPQRSVKVKI